MIELEADDALASAARIAEESPEVERVCIWTPDKDLAQCVRGERVVQMDRRGNKILGDAEVRAKYGVAPALIPDFLALVGDSADGYPGMPGIGAVGAARMLNRYGPIETFPPEVLGDQRELALLFKDLATLRTNADLFRTVDDIRWRGPTDGFADYSARIGASALVERAVKATGLEGGIVSLVVPPQQHATKADERGATE
jgi:5'-3' exonuclease